MVSKSHGPKVPYSQSTWFQSTNVPRSQRPIVQMPHLEPLEAKCEYFSEHMVPRAAYAAKKVCEVLEYLI